MRCLYGRKSSRIYFSELYFVRGDGDHASKEQRKQSLAIFGMGQDIDGLGYDPRSAHLATLVNPMIASVH